MRRFTLFLFVAAAACAGCQDEEGSICSAGALESALAAAAAGDIVELGACEIAGSFTVPAEVALVGAAEGGSVLKSDGEAPVVILVPGSSATEARGFLVESDGRAGLVTMGEGDVTIEEVTITASRGIGLGAEGTTALMMTEVAITGPITADNADSIDADAPADFSSGTATHGLVLNEIERAVLTDVSASGFAHVGALVANTEMELWRDGGASQNLGTGLMVLGGFFNADNIFLNETMAGQRTTPVAGMAVGEDAFAETVHIQASRTEGFGILQDAVTVVHRDLVSSANEEVAVWAQDCARFDLDESALVDNNAAGVVLIGVGRSRIDDSNVARTVMSTRAYGGDEVELADGMHIVAPTGPFNFMDTTLANNERVGLLVDLGGLSFSEVFPEFRTTDVEGSDDELGVVFQNGEMPEGWDAGVTRSGATLDNDAAFSGTLDVVGRMDLSHISFDAAFPDGLEGLVGAL